MRSVFDNAFKFFRLLMKRRSGYPQEIQIEVTNACNLACAMCPHTHGTVPQTDFPLERFETLVRNNPAPKRLVLTGWGEPLMHEQFFAMIERANKYWPDTTVRFTTNGILLNEENRQRILGHSISGITVSVDLWPERKEIPREWRDILHPPSPKTSRNLTDYIADERIRSRIPLTLQCLLVHENVDDIREYIRFAGERHISSVNLVRMQSYPQNPVQRPEWGDEQAMISDLVALGKKCGVSVRSVNQQHYPLRMATHFDNVCMRTDDSIYITVDGNITPCCNLRGYEIGALSEEGSSIAAAWNSGQEKAFFHDQSPVCGKCDALFHCYRD